VQSSDLYVVWQMAVSRSLWAMGWRWWYVCHAAPCVQLSAIVGNG